jgi:hypothetical protein
MSVSIHHLALKRTAPDLEHFLHAVAAQALNSSQQRSKCRKHLSGFTLRIGAAFQNGKLLAAKRYFPARQRYYHRLHFGFRFTCTQAIGEDYPGTVAHSNSAENQNQHTDDDRQSLHEKHGSCEELELCGLRQTVQRARLIDKGRRVSPALIRVANEFFDSMLAIPVAAGRIDAESIDR